MASHLHSPNLYLQAPKTFHDLTVFIIKFTELLNKFIFPDIILFESHAPDYKKFQNYEQKSRK